MNGLNVVLDNVRSLMRHRSAKVCSIVFRDFDVYQETADMHYREGHKDQADAAHQDTHPKIRMSRIGVVDHESRA